MPKRTDARTLCAGRAAREIRPVLERRPIRRAWLYGSVARGTQRAGSDVDLVVEPLENAGIGMGIVCLQDELEEALGGGRGRSLGSRPQAHESRLHPQLREFEGDCA